MNIEEETQQKGLTAPHITPLYIEKNIVSEYYFTAAEGVYASARALAFKECKEFPNKIAGPLDLITFAVLVLKNGFIVTGESAYASLENFDAEIGRKIARENAISKIGPLMG